MFYQFVEYKYTYKNKKIKKQIMCLSLWVKMMSLGMKIYVDAGKMISIFFHHAARKCIPKIGSWYIKYISNWVR